MLFIIFARPEMTARVMERIRAARPAQLFIAQDAPRDDHPSDIANCPEARKTAMNIDWPCEVKTLFQESNLGAGMGCATAIRWFFQEVEEGIVLQDDDLPEASFFSYCAELLEHYRHDDRIMHITGYNPLLKPVGDASYYFSRYTQGWGWASWRRVARHYDYHLTNWPRLKASGLIRALFRTRLQQRYYAKVFSEYHHANCNNWDQQWLYLVLSRGGLCINPNVNLVRNIGFVREATFAGNPWSYHGHRTTAPMPLPLRHPEFVLADPKADDEIMRRVYKVVWLRMLAVRLARPLIPPIIEFGFFLQSRRGRKEDEPQR